MLGNLLMDVNKLSLWKNGAYGGVMEDECVDGGDGRVACAELFEWAHAGRHLS